MVWAGCSRAGPKRSENDLGDDAFLSAILRMLREWLMELARGAKKGYKAEFSPGHL